MATTNDYNEEDDNLKFYETGQLILTIDKYNRIKTRIDEYTRHEIPYELKKNLFERLEKLNDALNKIQFTNDYNEEDDNLKFYETGQSKLTLQRYNRIKKRIDEYTRHEIPYYLQEKLLERLEILKKNENL
jgi:hypothetical protein